MVIQTEIDFEVHAKENNDESQAHLEENKDRFSKQCKVVYDLLLKGIRLNAKTAMNEHNIMALARRVKDLKDHNKIEIQDEWVLDGEGKRLYKEYYIPAKPVNTDP